MLTKKSLNRIMKLRPKWSKWGGQRKKEQSTEQNETNKKKMGGRGGCRSGKFFRMKQGLTGGEDQKGASVRKCTECKERES